MSSLSVVMPYYNNEATLAASLASFAAQSQPPKEIIVVDDGAPVPAAPIVAAYRGSVPVRLISAAHGGQSAATNAGIRAATGELQLLTCADIIAHEDLCATHVQAHLEQGEQQVVVLGFLPYHPDVQMTPFMRWLSMPARQFCFSLIRDTENVPAKYCYSPNISLRSALLRQVDGFDETFVYGYQDTDLGMRLEKLGVRFLYRERAIGHHLHPTTARRFYRRQVMVGEATVKLMRKWPDLGHVDRFATIIGRYRGLLPRLPNLLSDIESLETRLQKLSSPSQRPPKALVELYDFTMVVGMVEGMLNLPQDLRAIFGDLVPLPPAVPVAKSYTTQQVAAASAAATAGVGAAAP